MNHLPRPRLPRPALLGAALAALLLAGCTNLRIFNGTSTTPTQPSTATLAGNWQFDAVTSTGTAPFAALSGPLRTASTSAGVGATASMLAEIPAGASTCYTGEPLVPLQGTFAAPTLTLFSFSVTGQYLVLQASVDTTQTHLSAPFKITGGCADGVLGTITGTRFDPLTGTFAGPLATGAATLSLTQATSDPANGTIPVSGTATFSGIPCFTSGTTVAGAAYVSGSTVLLTLSTNDPSGSTVTLDATMDSSASTLSLTNATITGGSCAGSTSGTQLLRSSS